MKLDKQSERTLSKILNNVFGEGNVKIYQEVAVEGVSHDKLKMIEAETNLKDLERLSPFSKVIKSNPQEMDSSLKNVHNKVLEDLRENKKVNIDEKSFKRLVSNDNVVKRIGNLITEALTSVIEDPSVDRIKKMSIISKKSKDKELAKSYLLMKNPLFISSHLHVLAKGIKNLESPEVNAHIPQEIIQETGMLQIGMALNEIATSKPGTRIGDLTREKTVKIKKLSQSGGVNATPFLNECKKFARDWEERHFSQLQKLTQQQEDKIYPEKAKLRNAESGNLEDQVQKLKTRKTEKKIAAEERKVENEINQAINNKENSIFTKDPKNEEKYNVEQNKNPQKDKGSIFAEQKDNKRRNKPL